jgi:hypothetical protein
MRGVVETEIASVLIVEFLLFISFSKPSHPARLAQTERGARVDQRKAERRGAERRGAERR